MFDLQLFAEEESFSEETTATSAEETSTEEESTEELPTIPANADRHNCRR